MNKIKCGKGNERKFYRFSDPGHSWIKVPRKLLQVLEIENKISPYSYQRKGHVYLEEDCDFSIFYDAMSRHDIPLHIIEKFTNKPSKIRSYDDFKPSLT